MTDLPPLLISGAIVPERMSRLPRDARGLPIPYAQFVGSDGTPDFRVLDAHKVEHCLVFRRCGLCGDPMGRHLHFIGGPRCVAHGIFHDPPMHKECAEFALRACAHLNRSKGKYSSAPLPSEPGVKIIVGEMESDQKAEWHALMHTTLYTISRTQEGRIYIHARLPWLDVQRWRDGAPMEDAQ
jgi:hypothetical protein